MPARFGESLSSHAEGRLQFGFEQRVRYESRGGTAFGQAPDCATGLVRTRVSLAYLPSKWIKFSGMVQDTRTPGYGPNPPNTVRDPADLHEAYFEIRPGAKTGFGITAGRRMLNYGEVRLIGSPQWGNNSRSYDHVRVYYSTRRAHLEALVISPVKVRIGEFNRPVLGDRVWGSYDSFPEVWRKNLLEVYFLRRDQNRPGGFTAGSQAAGTDRLRLNTAGFRLVGPLVEGVKYSLEGVIQGGRNGVAPHRAYAWFSSVTWRWTLGVRPLDVTADYKYAFGSPNDPSVSRTFDQLYSAHHDAFGHQDLFGWRNIHVMHSQARFGVSKAVAVTAMYTNSWLASRYDSLYNGAGKAIARSATGSAGRHIGQEADVYATIKYRHSVFGAGYGYLLPGTFLKQATPGAAPSYVYIFHNYSL
ncbi:MAG TPA: alginate export family protein [Bryobacteraceae bacterium]